MILVETFHQLGGCDSSVSEWPLALADYLCHRTSYVFSKLCLHSFKGGGLSQVLQFV